ncbi:alpha/beta hydrolase, partial [Streptomyces sp. FH025]|uniref:alpha/beta hydrolase n=1 Tax=Streptomyces sp. FH025 TaxID=2815937 RepID=UPI001A9E1703
MTHAYDPELSAAAAQYPPVDFADVTQLREAEAEIMEFGAYEPPVPVETRDFTVPGPEGAPDVAVRLYRPANHDGVLPGVVYMHGGGFVIGSVDAFHTETTRIAAEVGAVVLSVDYRLAPEHPFPAALEDSCAALTWLVDHARELGVDPRRVAVAGESAGAGLAAAVALYARDHGGPALRMQYLGIPVLDDRLDTASMRAFTDTPGWKRSNSEVSWDFYLGGEGVRGGDGVSPYAAPARAESLSGLPPAHIVAGEIDPVRDEALDYAQRLVAAGVPTELHLFPGVFHGSSLVAPQAEVSRRMVTEQIAALRRGL